MGVRRVLYVDGCYDGTVGGSHSCLFTLVTNLDKERYHPVVVFYDDHIFARRLRETGIETIILPWRGPVDLSPLLRRLGGMWKMLGPVVRFSQKILNLWIAFLWPAIERAAFLRRHHIDILHVNNSLNTNHDWMLGAWISGVKLISHERGVSSRLSSTARAMGKIVDRFLCVSRMVYEHLRLEGLPVDRMTVVYDGLDFLRFDRGRDPGAVREALGLYPSQPVIGVLGNVKEWKGQETIIRATAILKAECDQLVCLIVGDAYEGDPYVDKLRALVSELDVVDNVRFLGYQERPAEFLGVMDVVCHTSISPEPFGMVNIEAMYMGKPVVATGIGGPLEVFSDGVDGFLVEPGNPQMLAEVVSRLLMGRALATRIGLAAQARVTERFDARVTAAEIQSAYDILFTV